MGMQEWARDLSLCPVPVIETDEPSKFSSINTPSRGSCGVWKLISSFCIPQEQIIRYDQIDFSETPSGHLSVDSESSETF